MGVCSGGNTASSSAEQAGLTTRRDFLKVSVLGAAGLAAVPANATPLSSLRTPYLQNVSPTSAAVLWTLPILGKATLSLTDSSGAARSIPADGREFPASQTGLANGYFQYQASLSGLTPDTVYSYSISCDGQPVANSLAGPLSFRTPRAGSPFTFLHLADSGTGSDAQRRLASLMSQESRDLVLANGDLAYDLGTWDAIERNYFGVYRDLMAQVPFFPSLGNHEYMTDAGNPSLAGWVTPSSGVAVRHQGRYYSFDWGNVHFVALDSNDPLARADAGDTTMLDWLENDLRATRKFWRIAFFHHPGYATGVHQDEPPAGQVRQYIVPILERYGVQLVLNGHEHNYQRTYPLLAGQTVPPDSGGIVYVTGGGGGQQPFQSPAAAWIAQIQGVNQYVRSQVSGSTMTLTSVAVDGAAVDSLKLAPLPRITGSALEPASLSTRLASGGLASIFGSNLCAFETIPGSPVTDAAGTSVRIDGNAVPVLYADAKQVNIQVPLSSSGTQVLEIRTPNGSASLGITIAPVAPAIFLTADGSGSAVAEHADGSIISPNSPAAPGETITILLTGLGATSGIMAPAPVVADVSVTFGGLSAELISAASDPSSPGVYRVVARVPSGVPAAAQVVVTAGGIASNAAALPILATL